MAQRHDDRIYVIWILDADYSYTQWLASRSLDWRWTLSPINGPWENEDSDGDQRRLTNKWLRTENQNSNS